MPNLPPLGVSSIELPVALEQVWAVVCDLEQAPRWHPFWRRVQLRGQQLAQQMGFSLRTGRLMAWPGNAWILRLEPPYRLELVVYPWGFDYAEELTFTLEPSDDPGSTRVTYSSLASGSLAVFAKPLLHWQAQRVLSNLKTVFAEPMLAQAV